MDIKFCCHAHLIMKTIIMRKDLSTHMIWYSHDLVVRHTILDQESHVHMTKTVFLTLKLILRQVWHRIAGGQMFCTSDYESNAGFSPQKHKWLVSHMKLV